MNAETEFPVTQCARDCQRQHEDVEREDEERSKNRGLKESCRGGVFGPVAIFRSDLPAQHQPEDDERVENSQQSEPKRNLGEIVGLSVEVWRQRVRGDLFLRGWQRGLS